MKRQIQKTGVRKWFGDDFLKLQNELYKSVEALLSQNEAVVVSGCEVADLSPNYSVSEGVVFIDGNLCFFEGINDTALPIYLTKEIIETENREYADGNDKPTEVHYRAKVNTSSQGGDEIMIYEEDQDEQYLFQFIHINKNGELKGVPKADIPADNTNMLATLKAVLNARLYFKENYNGGAIDKSSIPDGEAWMGKGAAVKIKENVITSSKPIHATNLPKLLFKVNADGSRTDNLGSMYNEVITIDNAAEGYYEISFNNITDFSDTNIIVQLTIEGFKTIEYSNGNADESIVVNTKEWDGSNMVNTNSDFYLTIYKQ